MPEPVAYSMRAAHSDGPHPAEGTRVRSAGAAPARGGVREERHDPLERVGPGTGDTSGDEDEYEDFEEEDPRTAPLIGRARPISSGTRPPTPVPVAAPPPRAQRGRYADDERKTPPVEDMRLYRRRGVLRYWYVPVAALLAILVAIGVVWGADRFMGGDDVPAGADVTPTPEAQETPEPTPTPEPEPTPDEELPPTELGPGATGVVAGTGAGGCLNIRVAPGTENDAIICVPDGTPFTVVSGPEQSGNFTWWEINSAEIVGWAADEYLELDSPDETDEEVAE